MPNLLLSTPPAPSKADKLIAKSGEKHKFWDLEAQIAQIFGTIPNPETQLGG